jgi:hypothetical protein
MAARAVTWQRAPSHRSAYRHIAARALGPVVHLSFAVHRPLSYGAKPGAKPSLPGAKTAVTRRHRVNLERNCGNVVDISVPIPLVTAGRTNSSPVAGRSLPCVFAVRPTSSAIWRSHAIDVLSRASAPNAGPRSALEPCEMREFRSFAPRCLDTPDRGRDHLRRARRPARPDADIVTRVKDRKCAAVQEFRRAISRIGAAIPREIVVETFHQPCNRSATNRPPTCKNA